MTNRSALSPHILFSEFRGPRILNQLDPNAPPAPAPDPKTDPKPNPEPAPAANPPKPEEPEGRITQLATDNKELKKKLKDFEDAEKKRLEDEAKARGEHEQLANQYKTESETEKAAREAAEAKLAKYEERMKKQIDAQLKGITDAEKQKKVREMLGDRPVEEQAEMLENILSLVGVMPTSFGGPIPSTNKNPDQNDLDAKKARHKELIKKTIDKTITGSERAEKNRLEIELSTEFHKQEEAKQAA